jgi:hypothetical protein
VIFFAAYQRSYPTVTGYQNLQGGSVELLLWMALRNELTPGNTTIRTGQGVSGQSSSVTIPYDVFWDSCIYGTTTKKKKNSFFILLSLRNSIFPLKLCDFFSEGDTTTGTTATTSSTTATTATGMGTTGALGSSNVDTSDSFDNCEICEEQGDNCIGQTEDGFCFDGRCNGDLCCRPVGSDYFDCDNPDPEESSALSVSFSFFIIIAASLFA